MTSNTSTSSLSPSETPLRSILKKPKVLAPGLGNTCLIATSNNGVRRTPTHYVLARSISECHDDQMLIGDDFHLGEDEVISMEDLTVAGGSPLSVCAEAEEEDWSMKPSEYLNGHPEDNSLFRRGTATEETSLVQRTSPG